MKQVTKYSVSLVKESAKLYDIQTKKIGSPDYAYRLLKEVFGVTDYTEEHFMLIALDTKNNTIGVFEVAHGTLNTANVHPREVFKRAITCNASSIILAHNHPSGESEPSREDIDLTERLVECGKIVGIKVIDHVIIGEEAFYSFKEEGLI